MRVMLALWLVGAGAQAANALPSWLGPLAVALASGGYLRYYTAKQDKRLKAALADTQQEKTKRESVDRQKLLDDVQREVLQDQIAERAQLRTEIERGRAERAELRAELEEAKTALLERERIGAEALRVRDNKIGVLSARIEQLHDQLLALESGEIPRKRRSDPPA